MAITVLTFTASEEELTSGVPEYVEIETNVPANVYYTIDGTEPSIDSAIYVGAIYFDRDPVPTSITLKAFGVDSDGYYGSVLTQVFAADGTLAATSRLINGEGVVVDSASDETNTVYGYDADGEASQFVDLTTEQVADLSVRSDRGRLGIEEGTQVQVNIPTPESTAFPFDDQFNPFSSPQYAATFDPYARTIVIDNRVSNEVELTLRTYGSFSNFYREEGGKRIRETADDACYISGGKVRTFYNAANNTMCSYYYDHNEARWIKNIQQLPANIPQTLGKINRGFPLVFTWIERGKQSSNLV